MDGLASAALRPGRPLRLPALAREGTLNVTAVPSSPAAPPPSLAAFDSLGLNWAAEMGIMGSQEKI